MHTFYYRAHLVADLVQKLTGLTDGPVWDNRIDKLIFVSTYERKIYSFDTHDNKIIASVEFGICSSFYHVLK